MTQSRSSIYLELLKNIVFVLIYDPIYGSHGLCGSSEGVQISRASFTLSYTGQELTEPFVARSVPGIVMTIEMDIKYVPPVVKM